MKIGRFSHIRERIMSLAKYAGVSLLAVSASMGHAGGWEASTLDTSLLYTEGSAGNVSTASLTPSHVASQSRQYDTTTSSVARKVLNAETRTSIAAKADLGPVSVGVNNFKSGSIQFTGGSKTGGSWIPDADATMTTTSVTAKYAISDTYDILAGLSMNSLAAAEISTVKGTYNVGAKTSTGYLLGAAYSIPEIALRVEALYQPKSKISSASSFTETAIPGGGAFVTYADNITSGAMEAAAVGSYAASGGNAIVSDVASFTTTLSRPEMLTLNFQSGVNQRTLVFGSIHQATWSKSQINAASGASTEISTAFTDTTSYSIGLGRKINDNFSVSASFKSEEGSGATGTSYFTLSNGSQGISLGGSYTMDNTEFRAGYNYTQIGGVTISDALGQVALYPTNSISAFGVSATIKF
jgi:hypothetical protein